MKFLQILEAIIGKRSHRPTMSASTTGRVSRKELHGMAKLSRWTFRQEPETYSGGKKLTVIMTSDVDPNSGKVFKDFEARRQKLQEEEENRESNRSFGAIDVRPDDE
jgi:C4-type Zn-finger protein